MTKPARFTKADIRRAVEAAREADLLVSGFTIEPDGTITVLSKIGLPANDTGNPLDRLLGG